MDLVKPTAAQFQVQVLIIATEIIVKTTQIIPTMLVDKYLAMDHGLEHMTILDAQQLL